MTQLRRTLPADRTERTGDIAKIEENVAKVVGRKGKNKNDEVIQSREAEGIVYRVTAQ